ncbi:hypothetical protein CAOG_009460 [Capsaspora owczarzaki ATCC 30864]|uniref:Uncharacterized protein n=1 Tax=Capsaspora owczarzaki (strain ATCC 30864) TaxID=595528 RepID=A0A0D2X199_CAPO3|nr:hypothetical protein CAOG_009460 [Capsaspora owczarzaki ATCC 30864]
MQQTLKPHDQPPATFAGGADSTLGSRQCLVLRRIFGRVLRVLRVDLGHGRKFVVLGLPRDATSMIAVNEGHKSESKKGKTCSNRSQDVTSVHFAERANVVRGRAGTDLIQYRIAPKADGI